MWIHAGASESTHHCVCVSQKKKPVVFSLNSSLFEARDVIFPSACCTDRLIALCCVNLGENPEVVFARSLRRA